MSFGHILIVDDEEQIRELLKKYFTDSGYDVVTASGGEDAIRKFAPEKFDCVISDFAMPDRDGLDVLKTIRNQDRRVVFLMVTGYPSLDIAIKAIKEGASDYITKPFHLEDIKIKVERALNEKKTNESLRKVTGLFWALIISIPMWLILGAIVGLIWKR